MQRQTRGQKEVTDNFTKMGVFPRKFSKVQIHIVLKGLVRNRIFYRSHTLTLSWHTYLDTGAPVILGIRKLGTKGQSIILTRGNNSHILFHTPFGRCNGLFCLYLILTMKKNGEDEQRKFEKFGT